MHEATLVSKANRQKVKRWSRKQLRKDQIAMLRERKREERVRARERGALRDDDRLSAAFRGCDPERMLRLIGEA